MQDLIDIVLLFFLVVTALAVLRMRDLFATVMLTGIFSLLSAGLLMVWDAVDVAFTEAAVGAGIVTVLMLGTLHLTGKSEKAPAYPQVLPLVVTVVTGAALIYGTLDMPIYGDPAAPIHQHVVPRYLNDSYEEIGIPNVVASVLASYRGYDTLGETTVIFTAGIGVLLLLGTTRRNRKDHGDDDSDKDGGA